MNRNEKQYVAAIVVLALTSIAFSILYFTKKTESAGGEKNLAENSTKALSLKDYESSKHTGPVPDELGKQYIDYFQNNINVAIAGRKIFPYKAVWVEKAVINSAFNDASVDGFYIYPIQYSTPISVQQGRGVSFAKGDVNFMISFTKDSLGSGLHYHVDIPGDKADYNNPCPNPPCP